MLSTIDLLIKLACFLKGKKYFQYKKRSELVITRRSTTQSLPHSLVNLISEPNLKVSFSLAENIYVGWNWQSGKQQNF